MVRFLACALAVARDLAPAKAALDIGERAPLSRAGRAGRISLPLLAGRVTEEGTRRRLLFPRRLFRRLLDRGPLFRRSDPEFKALGASVIGVSGDDIETLTKFSVQACQGMFPVAADEAQMVMKSFDAVMQTRPEYANRISYVIAPDGTSSITT